ncbi:NADPH-dependent F420 reductase [Actinoalloteichus sp. GBA129-24]|uniref:NADPH-dependent F420 reductase n=1 Tax=Actinoalloteichus sp. GBA129-24 TaxID=1612551 RepID=UPI0009503D27|nr:NAD(P)-binding domain-containing protein [Actinoalloteichus sp. GBA129-24]APU19471.1 reduced coenzyme F420:NADP oxidoreductase [Actinoalloteichus sp. GBA129-24]
MRIAIVGTGALAGGLGDRLLRGQHEVVVFGRTTERAERLAALLGAAGAGVVTASTIGDPLPAVDLVILAVPGAAVPDLMEQYGEQLPGQIVVDATNPAGPLVELHSPAGFSMAERIAALAPMGTSVVKAFNTTFAGTLAGDESLDVFIATDDPEARMTMVRLVQSIGCVPIDAGPLHHARALETMQWLHHSLQSLLGTRNTTTISLRVV